MQKLKNVYKYILLVMLMIGIGFAAFFVNAIQETAYADIAGLSGNNYVLTGFQGYQPAHYFTDNLGKSRLIFTDYKAVTYLDKNGNSTSKYNVLVPDVGMATKYSEGYASVYPTSDLQELAANGVLYVKASAGLLALGEAQKDKIKICISYTDENGEVQKKEVTSNKVYSGSGIYNPDWVSTEYIKVNTNNPIIFSFTNLEASNFLSQAKFMIFEPTIFFRTMLEEVNFENNDEIVYPKQLVDLLGNTKISNLTTVTDLTKYYKAYHKVSYSILEGAEYANIQGSYLEIKSNAPNGSKIVIKARAKKDSTTNEYIESKTVTYTVNAQKQAIMPVVRFQNYGSVTGSGFYYTGQRVTLTANLLNNFNFISWEVNGQTLFTTSVTFTVSEDNNIKLNLTKNILVSGIDITKKVYDGTNKFNGNIVFDGKEEDHDLSLGGVNVYYSSFNVGEAIRIVVEGEPKLVGNDADIYVLTSQKIPAIYADIYKREVEVRADHVQKIYGTFESTLTYSVSNLAEGEILQGNLTREEGEKVGIYNILVGSLQSRNPNYIINYISNTFEIVKKDLTLRVVPQTKTYDGKKTLNFTASLIGVLSGEDVGWEARIEFASANASSRVPLNVLAMGIYGNDWANYTLKEVEEVYGIILPKEIVVKANAAKITYGESLVLTYKTSGLIGTDSLNGSLTIGEDFSAGIYDVLVGTLNNPNYTLSYVSATCTILKRNLNLVADNINKIYGDADPELSFVAENLLEGDTLSGRLEREAGENTGNYNITLGSIYNKNYNIDFTGSIFKIIKRNTDLQIAVADKVYDGNNFVHTYYYSFTNLAGGDNLIYSANLLFENAVAGENKKVIVNSESLSGENILNYNISYNSQNLTATILRKTVDVHISSSQKIYGEADPEIIYSLEGVVSDEKLNGALNRNPGEETGEYSIYLDSLNNENNLNYNIVLVTEGSLIIKPRPINVSVLSYQKNYGEDDPIFAALLIDGFVTAFGQELGEILSGSAIREEGEYVGSYRVKIGSLTANKNYILTFIENNFLIVKKHVTVSVLHATKVYGENDPVLKYVATGLNDSEQLNLILRRDYGENVGEYEIKYNSLNDSRYEIKFVSAFLTITPLNITVKADNNTKIYGEDDPDFGIVVDEPLMFNDILSEVITGTLSRRAGENVGEYQIERGSFSLGENYTVTFVPGEFKIIPETLEVSANESNKQYGDSDPELTFKITKGSLKFNDAFSGKLQRTEGEALGEYLIGQGNLNLSDNYTIKFHTANFKIEKRNIVVRVDKLSKFYGENDPEISYSIEGSLFNGDVLSGQLYREKPTSAANPLLYENVGTYNIICNLYNGNYEISFITESFVIKAREIYIRAFTYVITYGEQQAELKYEILNPEDILNGDLISGDIYRVPGDDAGIYDIRSALSLGTNYKIIFTKGQLIINPIQIVVKTNQDLYEKTYKQNDPNFEYEIVSGSLINGDRIYGSISREAGENVGTYKLVSSLSNQNYNFILQESYLKILPKDVNLILAIHDKVWDGTTVAYIKTPVVSGLLDKGITLVYDKENSAKFETSAVGYDIPVTLFDITLSGEMAANYNLIFPSNITGNITYNVVQTEEVMISTYTNTSLPLGTTLRAESEKRTAASLGLYNKQFVTCYNIWLEKDGINAQLSGSVTLRIALPEKYVGRNNLYVYRENEDGTYTLVSSRAAVDGYIEINTSQLGTYVVISDNEMWIDIGAYISVGVFGIMVVAYLIYSRQKNKKLKNKQK